MASGSPAPGETGSWIRLLEWCRRERLILTIAAGGFMARLLLSGWNSYWLDELLSTQMFGMRNPTLVDAIGRLADESVHPPLYQTILYGWMRVSGDTEVATRSVSNLYMAAATVVLFVLIRRTWGRTTALFTAIGFSVMYLTTNYAIEASSHAQTILLATVAALLFLSWARNLIDDPDGPVVLAPAGVGLIAVNTALWLTHYFNGFLIAAQVVAIAAFITWRFPPRRWILKLATASLLHLIPAVVFAGLWGRVLLETFDRFDTRYRVEGGEDLQGVVDLLRSIVYPNLNPHAAFKAIMAVAVVSVMLHALARLFVGDPTDRVMAFRDWSVLYLGTWAGGPLAASYLAFSVSGVARYNTRYFLYCLPALAALLFVAAHRWSDWLGRWIRSTRFAAGLRIGVSLLLVAALVPGFYASSVRTKHDWRGLARQVVEIVDRAPEAAYLVFETSVVEDPLLDYYLARFSDRVRVTDTITLPEEREGRFRFQEEHGAVIEGADFLIVTFAHRRVRDFPKLLDLLNRVYTVHHRQLDGQGRGFVIFAVRGRS